MNLLSETFGTVGSNPNARSFTQDDRLNLARVLPRYRNYPLGGPTRVRTIRGVNYFVPAIPKPKPSPSFVRLLGGKIQLSVFLFCLVGHALASDPNPGVTASPYGRTLI